MSQEYIKFVGMRMVYFTLKYTCQVATDNPQVQKYLKLLIMIPEVSTFFSVLLKSRKHILVITKKRNIFFENKHLVIQIL